MSRSNDTDNDRFYSSDRYFFADGKWYYYVRTYNNGVKVIGAFDTKAEAESSCSARFSDLMDFHF